MSGRTSRIGLRPVGLRLLADLLDAAPSGARGLLCLLLLAGCPGATAGPARIPAGGPPGRLQVSLEDRLGSGFVLIGFEVRLDDEPLMACGDDERTLDAATPFVAFDGGVPSGDHVLDVHLRCRGSGHGVFSYLSQYRFDVRSSLAFALMPGDRLGLRAVAWERGDETTDLSDRPAVRFEEDGDLPTRTVPVAECPWAEPAPEDPQPGVP